MMYSAYKLNKQGDNIQPWYILFTIWNQSVVPCLVLTLASWPAYRFLRRLGQVFLELSCFFNDPADVGNLIPGSSAFSKSSLSIWKFMVHILLKPSLKNFEHYFTSMSDECNCAIVWEFFAIAFLWDWNENWPFLVLWPLLSFQICWHIEYSTFTASSLRIWNSSTGIPSPPLA